MTRLQKYSVWAALCLTTVLPLSPAEATSHWKHIGPLVRDDMHAYLDYQRHESDPRTDDRRPITGPHSWHFEARPVWINIHRSDLAEGDGVFVQLISYEQLCYRGVCHNNQAIRERNLTFAEPGRFTGELGSLTLSYQLNDGYAITNRTSYRQELVIWINGVLYQDYDERNFSFRL